jgi:hypothetical protein
MSVNGPRYIHHQGVTLDITESLKNFKIMLSYEILNYSKISEKVKMLSRIVQRSQEKLFDEHNSESKHIIQLSLSVNLPLLQGH